VTSASLTRSESSSAPRAVVLLLHGGRASGDQIVNGRSASWRRMRTLQRAIAPRLHATGAHAWLLRYERRGWNDAAPVRDARWALDEVRRTHGTLPVVLLGHSMGARTAVHVADDPSVVGVVGLAPWWAPADPVRTLTGRHLRAAHGRSDRITSYAMTAAYVERARQVALSAEFQDMGEVGHYLLRRVGDWNDYAAESVIRLLG
jgi:predicted esterase